VLPGYQFRRRHVPEILSLRHHSCEIWKGRLEACEYMLLHHAYGLSVGKTKGRRLLGRPGRRWV